MRRSNPVTWDQIRVGLVLIVAMAVLSVGVFFIGQVGDVFDRRYQLVTLMESATGLQRGAPVQVAGQNVGQVERIDFIAPDDRVALVARASTDARWDTTVAVSVRLGISEGVRDQIRRGSTARVRTQGLLGDRLIDIEPGFPPNAVLAPGDTIGAAPALSYEELLDDAADAVESLTNLSNDLGATLARVSAGEGSLGQLLVDETLYAGLVELNSNLNAVMGPIAAGDGAIARLLEDEEIYDRLLSATTRLDSVTGAVVAGEGTLGQLITSDSLYRAIASSATRADSLLAVVQRGDGSVGRLVTDETLYEELLRVVVDLNAFLADVRANPRKFIPPIKVF